MKNYFLLLILAVLLSCKSENETQIIQLEGFVFGTTYHITFLNDAPNTYQKSIDSVFHLMNKSLSTYIPTSDISKINGGDTTIVVDAYLEEVLLKSKRIFKETGGYFDPTVGNLVNAYGFGAKELKNEIDTVTVLKMMETVGFDKISLIDRKVVKQNPNIYFDFNSIAKGFGVDVVGRLLESKNITNYLVEIGGEIRARGKNKKNRFWTVAIEKPNTDGTQSIQTTTVLENESMATSGNYRKYRVTKDGKKYVHTVNPKTGFATESNLLSASVMSKSDCADVDAYATAFMAMGLEKTLLFLKKYPSVHAVLLYLDKNDQIVEYNSKK